MTAQASSSAGMRERLRAFVENAPVQRVIYVLIVINAVTLGLETWSVAMATAGDLLIAADRIMLAIFSVEIAARLVAYGPRFFRDPWNVFDFVVVGIAWIPTTEGTAVLRALRVLRILRIVSAVPKMRHVVEALLGAIPGIGAIAALLGLVFYVGAVMATKLFGADFPEWFGSVGASLYSLFQIMTLESWSMGIVRPVMEIYPGAWIFFVPFILVTTFTVLNLFIAVIVGAMQTVHSADASGEAALAAAERAQILEEVRALRVEIDKLAAARRAGNAAESRP